MTMAPLAVADLWLTGGARRAGRCADPVGQAPSAPERCRLTGANDPEGLAPPALLSHRCATANGYGVLSGGKHWQVVILVAQSAQNGRAPSNRRRQIA